MNILKTLTEVLLTKNMGSVKEKEDGKNDSQKPIRRSLTDFVNVEQPK